MESQSPKRQRSRFSDDDKASPGKSQKSSIISPLVMSEQEEMLNNENHSFGLTDPFDDNFEETFQGKKSENVGCSARISSNSSLFFTVISSAIIKISLNSQG